MITVAELRRKIEQDVPGHPERPNHLPQGLYLPIPECDGCEGTGWKLSERFGTYFICSCVLRTREDTPRLPYRD
jgi:hypothetical protein